MTSTASLRHLSRPVEYDACVRLQRITWGDSFTDIVPASILLVSQKVGGLVAGAFNSENEMVGFVFSLIGSLEDKLVHWSHMLAVHPEARGKGLGRQLKMFQRDELLKRGIRTVFWTFDPLQARNAHLNLNRLGAEIVGYVPNMYGDDTGSPLHGGGGTDRLIVRWELQGQRARWAVQGDALQTSSAEIADSPLVTPPEPPDAIPEAGELPESSSVKIEIPCDLMIVAEHDPARLARWRQTVRRAFLTYLGRGYATQSFHRDMAARRCYYYLRRA